MNVLLLTGPSGVGKSTISKLLLKEFPNRIGFSVSHTTRKLRAGEVAGVDYIPVAKQEMLDAIKQGAFAEHAVIHGELYGTSFQSIEKVHNDGKIVLLDVDMHGVRSIKASNQLYAKCVGIVPPSFEDLKSRLVNRKSESEEQIAKRLDRARHDIDFCMNDPLVDHVIVNHDSWTHGYPELRHLVTQEWWKPLFSSDSKL